MARRPSLRGVLLAPDTSGDDAYSSVEARGVLTLLASLRPGRSWTTRAETLYVSALTLALLVGMFWGLSKRLGALLLEVAGFYHFAWGAPAIVLVFLAAFRYSTVQGFVSFTEPDCLLVLPAPLRRKDLVLPRLGTAGSSSGFAGALAGTLVADRLSRDGAIRGPDRQGGSCRLRLGSLGRSGKLARAAPALGHAVGTASDAAGSWPHHPSGLCPGGRVDGQVGRAVVRALGLGHPAGLGGGLLVRGGSALFFCARWRWREGSASSAPQAAVPSRSFAAGRGPALRWSPACTRSTGGRSAQAGKGSRARTWQSRLRVRLPRRQILIVPWHSAVALLRSPVRLGWGIMLAGAGMVLLALQPTGQGTLWAGAVALYLAATSLLEPLRLEVDSPATARLFLPWPFDKVLWLHCLLPTAIVVVAGVFAVAGATALGYVTAGAFGTMMLLVIPLSLVVVLAAAFSARRGGRVSANLINVAALDTTGFSFLFVLLRLAMWAILALVVTVVAVYVVGRAHFTFGLPLLEVFGGLVVLALALQRGFVAMPTAAE